MKTPNPKKYCSHRKSISKSTHTQTMPQAKHTYIVNAYTIQPHHTVYTNQKHRKYTENGLNVKMLHHHQASVLVQMPYMQSSNSNAVAAEHSHFHPKLADCVRRCINGAILYATIVAVCVRSTNGLPTMSYNTNTHPHWPMCAQIRTNCHVCVCVLAMTLFGLNAVAALLAIICLKLYMWWGNVGKRLTISDG